MQTVELPADVRIAQCLEVSVGDPVVLYERGSSADDIPLSLSSRYFPGALFPGLVAHCQTDWSISSMLQIEYHCDHNSSFHPAVSTAAASSARAHFRMPATKPSLLSESINVDHSRRVVEYGVTRLRGDRMERLIEND